MAINFFTEQVTFTLKGKIRTRKWLEHCLQLKKKAAGELNFIFCSDNYLLKINRKYLHHDYFTDIITFPASTGRSNQVSGDIFISIDRVKANAKNFGTTFYDELNRVMAHGILHLCGYNDQTKAQTRLMRQKEDKFLELRVWRKP